MDYRYAISLIFEAHLPFVREYKKDGALTQSGEEGRFFDFVSESFLPLLETLNRLENDHVPFRITIAFSPVLCHMLNDELLQNKYLHYIDKQIEFGKHELDRTANDAELNKLVHGYLNHITESRTAYIDIYEKNLLKAIDSFRRKGKVEIMASCATHAFLPFISCNHESMQAQMEIPVPTYRKYFGGTPQGFWIPWLGWNQELEPYLTSHNYTYTVLDSHGLLFGKPTPEKGCFYPIKTPNGTYILGRDLHAVREIRKYTADEVYRNSERDAGYELPHEIISPFLTEDSKRHRTGYKYWSRSASAYNGSAQQKQSAQNIYNPQAASEKVKKHAKEFLENTIARLEEASKYMDRPPISVNAHTAASFGVFWYEGLQFVEALFRMAKDISGLKFETPSEYIYKQDLSSIQTVVPEYTSSGVNGYAETWLNVSNDWIYRHLLRAMERMTELAERFPDDTGLKERALNQAAREILLAQSSDWSALLHKQDSTEYAHKKAENSLRNFTTIYEALGSNYISTEWLTTLERKHNIFPNINYRVFRRKNNTK